MNTNRGGQGSSNSAGHDASRRGTSEAGGNRGQGNSPSASRPAVSLNRDAMRTSLTQKKQVAGSSTAATADKGQAAAIAASGQATATASSGQAAATASREHAAASASKGKAPLEQSPSGRGKDKRRLKDASRPPHPNKVRVTDGPEGGLGASSSTSAPVGEIPLGGVYVPAWNIREGSSALDPEVATEMFEHSCLLKDL